jgi:DNA-binding CsgD family transcriptional regulator
MAPTAVLGRVDELSTIRGFLAEFPAGPHWLVIAGEAGIGKTILWEAAEQAARGRPEPTTVLRARASEPEAELPYVGLTDLLGPVVETALPGLPPPQRAALEAALLLTSRPDDAFADPRTIGTAVLGVLRETAQTWPLILAIDDLQWLDPASAAALEFALRRLLDAPVGLIATIRATAGTPRPPLATLAPPPDRVHLDLGPISLGVLHHLVRDRTGLTLTRPQLVRLEAASGGNPLLAIETAAALGRLERWPLAGEPLPVPTDAAALLGERIGRLSATDREILFMVAAMASPTTDALRRVGDRPPAEVEAAIARGAADGLLLVETDGRLRFGHPLMAEAALGAVTPEARRALHERLAAAAIGVEDRGRHVALAAREPNSADAAILDEAASSARRRGATSMAAEWDEVAARLTPPDDVAARGTRLIRAARWFGETGEVERAVAILDRVMAEMRGDLRASAGLLRAQIAGWEESPAEVVRRCEAALEDATDPQLRARILLRLGGEPVVSGERALSASEEAVRTLESMTAAPDPDLLACALLQAAGIRFELGRGSDEAAVTRARGLLSAQPRWTPDGDELPESLRAHAMIWDWAVDHDDLAVGRAGKAADLQRDREHGVDRPIPIGAAELAMVETWLGDWDAAEVHARESGEAAEQAPTREGQAAALMAAAHLAAHRGDLAAAEAAAMRGIELYGGFSHWVEARCRETLGLVALSRGDARSALEILGPLHDAFMATGRREVLGQRYGGDLAEAAVAAGDLERARNVVSWLTEIGTASPRPWSLTMAARGRALIHAAQGDLDAADAAAREALDAAGSLQMPIERARTELITGRIARRRKEKRRATEHLQRARDGFAALGAARWIEIADADLARVGRRVSDADGTAGAGMARPDALTDTEDRVARLAARGLTNRQVAEAAFLAPKSVEGVLARVYAKLGIRSRAELGAWLASQDEPAEAGPSG